MGPLRRRRRRSKLVAGMGVGARRDWSYDWEVRVRDVVEKQVGKARGLNGWRASGNDCDELE